MARLHDEYRDVGTPGSDHVGEARKQQQSLVCRRVDEGHERTRFLGRQHGRPVDRRFDRRADEPDFLAVVVGQEPTACERMVHVVEIPCFVIAEAADGKRGGDASRSRARHRFQDHRVPVAGDQLVRRELVQELIKEREVLPRLRAIGSRLVVVARQEQCDRHALDGVLDDLAFGHASFLVSTFAFTVRRRKARGIDALRPQMFLDGEGHSTLEAGGRQDVALVAGVREPLHDRAQALRDSGGWIADAVVVHEEKAHT